MCLIVFSWNPESNRPLILAANRDEFHARKSLDAHYWSDEPCIFGGRDTEKMGTWLGIAKQRDQAFRFAALTNVRLPDNRRYETTRGDITRFFLNSKLSPQAFINQLNLEDYAAFNALICDGKELVFCHHQHTQAPIVKLLSKGVYGLSNAQLDTPWPKVESTKKAFDRLDLNGTHKHITSHLITFLSDNKRACDEELPKTGVCLEWERLLSAPFIISPNYGTRTSTILVWEKALQQMYFYERQHLPSGEMRSEHSHIIA